MFPKKQPNIYYTNYRQLVFDLIQKYHNAGGTMKKTKSRLYFYDQRQKQISESINYFPELLK